MDSRLVAQADESTRDDLRVDDSDARARVLIASAITLPTGGSARKRTMLPRSERRSGPVALVHDGGAPSRRESTLADAAARYRTAFDASVVPTAVVLLDPAGQGAIIDGNASFDRLTSELGLPGPARHLAPFLDAESCAALDAVARRAGAGQTTTCESDVVAGDGRTHRLIISASLVDAPHDARLQAVVQIEDAVVADPTDSPT